MDRPVLARASARRGASGFTLIEISLVLLILALVLSLVVPHFRDPSRAELHSHVRRLATAFRLLRSEAVLNGRIYRLNYDLERNVYWYNAEAVPGQAEAAAEPSGLLARPVRLPRTVVFSDVVLLGAGKLDRGLAYTRFYPDGFVDPTIVHMDNGREAFTLAVWPLTGHVTIYEGYRDLEFIQG